MGVTAHLHFETLKLYHAGASGVTGKWPIHKGIRAAAGALFPVRRAPSFPRPEAVLLQI